MFLGGKRLLLAGQLSKSATDAEAGVTRLDDVVDVTVLCCLIRICEELAILFLLLGKEGAHVFAGFLLGLGFLRIEHSHGTATAHHGDFS